MMASPGDQTIRMLVPQGYDAADSSDGIPVSSDDADSQVTPQSHDEHSVPEEVVVSEPTVRLPTLTLSETFTVLWLVQCAARSVGVDVEAEPMPYNAPTGVHLWSPDHKALCRWLQRERKRHFASIAIEQTIEVHKIEAARFLLRSLADGLPMAKVIEVGPRRFVHLAFRSGEE